MPPGIRSTRSRRSRYGLLTAAVAAATVTIFATLAATPAQAATTLRSLAEGQGKYFGTALTDGDLNIGGEMAIANVQFDMVTPGNEMKWDTTEPSNGSYNFGPGDQIVNWAQAHNARVRGHNLVWHSQLPGWVNNLPTNQVQGVMESHITTEATHYKGKVYAWDVINEPFNEDGSLRQDVFYRAMGSGYLADAIRTAHNADPNAKLYINDYNIEGENAKSNALYTMAQQMLAQGVPLGGIGLESHFIDGQVPSSMLANMQRFANLGLDVAVTELDDRIQLPTNSSNLQQQANDYTTVIKDCLAVSRCVGVSQWGVDDGHSWIPGTFPGYGAATMWDSNYQPKPAYNAAISALSTGGTTTGGTTGSTTTTGGTTGSTTTGGTTGSTTTGGTTGSTTTTGGTTGSTTGGTGGGCHVTYTKNEWTGGFTADVVVANTGSAPVNGWTLGFSFPGDQKVTNAWNATVTQSGNTVKATNVSYDGSIAPGGTVDFGFQGTWASNDTSPSSFTLNGAACS